jgi:hypothetical protein
MFNLSRQVKDAYMKLTTDPAVKRNFVMHIENATQDYRRERRKLIAKGVSVLELFPNSDTASSFCFVTVHQTELPLFHSFLEEGGGPARPPGRARETRYEALRR